MSAWWWLLVTKTCSKLYIIEYIVVLWRNAILISTKTQWDGSYQISRTCIFHSAVRVNLPGCAMYMETDWQREAYHLAISLLWLLGIQNGWRLRRQLLTSLPELAVRLLAAVVTLKPAALKKVWTDLACNLICDGLLTVPILRAYRLSGVCHFNL